MPEKQQEELFELTEFLLKYATHLMGCGVHTSRVMRNTRRIGEAYGYEVEISILNLNVMISLKDKQHHLHTTEMAVVHHLPINFNHNAQLSELSWRCHDEHIALAEVKQQYDTIIAAPRLNKWCTLLMASAANAAFCQLFGGDLVSIVIVFFATGVAFYFRTLLMKLRLNVYVQVLLTAFVASFLSSSSLLCHTTSSIALATSVLFLVPGVPLINGVIDTIEGHVLTGITRLINAILWVICLAIGLGLTLIITKGALIC